MIHEMTDAGVSVQRWLAKNDKRQRWLQEQLGITGHVQLWRYLTGERVCPMNIALRIKAITGTPLELWPAQRREKVAKKSKATKRRAA